MIKVTFKTYEKTLGKWYENVKTVKTMADFRLYAFSLYSGNWEIIKTESV